MEQANQELTQKLVTTTTHTKTTIVATLPVHLFVSYWLRHELSEIDIRTTLDAFSPTQIWMAVVLMKGNISSSALKCSFASRLGVLVSSKLIAIRKLTKLQPIKNTAINRLYMPPIRVEYIPPLPIHRIDEENLGLLRASLVSDLGLFALNRISRVFTIKDCQWIPIRVESCRYLVLARVYLKEVFDASGKDTGGFITRPIKLIDTAGTIYCIAEERLLIGLSF
jgi:hypothetical protein